MEQTCGKLKSWKDYEVLDTGNGEKLERWGDYLLVPPGSSGNLEFSPQAPGLVKRTDIIHRSSKGGGEWEFLIFPRNGASITVISPSGWKPFSFKHTGLFPEQAVNWDWFSDIIRKVRPAFEGSESVRLYRRRNAQCR